MYSDSGSLKEKIKNITIVVLLLTAILLLYFLWFDEETGNIKLGLFEQQETPAKINVSDVMIPAHTDISFGDGTYGRSADSIYWIGGNAEEADHPDNKASDEEGTVVDLRYDDIMSVRNAFKEVLTQEDILAEEITEDQYEELLGYTSVREVFGYDIPFEQYAGCLGCEAPMAAKAVGSFREIGFSEAQSDSLLIKDGQRGRFYRIVSGYDASELVLSCAAHCREFENCSYIYLDEAVGTKTGARILVPLTAENGPEPYTVLPDFTNDDRSAIEGLARDFYGDSFDFVRMIEEKSGRTIYMYGYSEEILTLDNGTLTYKSETAGTGEDDLITALETALAGISKTDGSGSAEGPETKIALTGAEKLSEGFRFEFSAMCGGLPVCFGEKNALIAEVSGDRITYLYRQYPVLSSAEGQSSNETAPVSPVMVLTEGYGSIYSLLRGPLQSAELLQETDPGQEASQDKDAADSGDERMLPQEEKFNYICGSVTDISRAYLVIDKGEEGDPETAVPCWRIQVLSGRAELFYDYYSGQLLKIKLENETV